MQFSRIMDITSGKIIGTLMYPEVRSLLKREDFPRRMRFSEEGEMSGRGLDFWRAALFLEEDDVSKEAKMNQISSGGPNFWATKSPEEDKNSGGGQEFQRRRRIPEEDENSGGGREFRRRMRIPVEDENSGGGSVWERGDKGKIERSITNNIREVSE